ncbi:uncharacterized protein [Littorina saxatilis]|uniref:uncharacterized protein isoform X2 n=1 Tax=Littorina saxatilis TaxID=31220 RepID=UPI0038B67B75
MTSETNMRMPPGWVLCSFLFTSLLNTCTGVTVSPCGSDKTAEVVQGKTDNVFTCSGVSRGEAATWRWLYQSSTFTAGSCPGNGGACTGGDLGIAFTPTRESSTSIRLNVNPTQLNNDVVVRSGVLRCATGNSQDSCQTDYIVPAQGTCRIQTGTGPERFLLTGTCNLQDGAMTSRSRYRCEWYSKNETSPASLNLNKTLTSANYRTGCVLSQSVPTDTGQYIYTVTLIPGRAVSTAGNITIVRPSPPTINCSPRGFVPVNTDVVCTCTASGVGQPQGRLKGIKVTDGSVINVGTYGATPLQLSPQTLSSSDHDVDLFRCDMEWVENITGQSHTPQIGIPPSRTFLRLNNKESDHITYEGQHVTFGCETSNGRPAPTVKLLNQDNNTELYQNVSSLVYTVMARCEDSGVYVCTSDNEMGPAVVSMLRTLSVQCQPRGPQDLGEVNFTGNPVSVGFDVTAYPVPHQISFTYIGMCDCQAVNQHAVTGITLEGRCRAKTAAIYIFTCTVTVSSVATVAATGVYRIDVVNEVGNASFRLLVQVKGITSSSSEATDTPYRGLAVGFGVLSAVLIVVVTVILLWLWRHQWILPCAEKHTSRTTAVSKRDSSADDFYLEPITPPPDFQAPTGPYATLNVAEIGQRSEYSEIVQRKGDTPTSADESSTRDAVEDIRIAYQNT